MCDAMENGRFLNLVKSRFQEFYLSFCGISHCEPLHYYGPAVRPTYILHYILSGKGVYKVGEKTYQLSAGQVFLIEPDRMTFYQADAKDPWSYIWMGFNGTGAAREMAKLGFSENCLVASTPDGAELKQIVLESMQHTDSSEEDRYFLQGQIYRFMSVLSRSLRTPADNHGPKDNEHVKAAVQYLQSHYDQKVDIEDVAYDLALNRSYLSRIFKAHMGISPKEFLTQFRLSKARELLILTRLSVDEVAHSCGYANALAFGKVFRQEMNMNATAFRRLHQARADVPQGII